MTVNHLVLISALLGKEHAGLGITQSRDNSIQCALTHLLVTVQTVIKNQDSVVDFEALEAGEPDLDYDLLCFVQGEYFYVDVYTGKSEFTILQKQYKPNIRGISNSTVAHKPNSIRWNVLYLVGQFDINHGFN